MLREVFSWKVMAQAGALTLVLWTFLIWWCGSSPHV
jgi:hypothetical protein